MTLFIITWTCRHANTTTDTLSALTWITFNCTWLFNVVFATTRNHAILKHLYTVTCFSYHHRYKRLKILWHTHMILPYYHLYLPYQPLASTVVLNHMHPNELQT